MVSSKAEGPRPLSPPPLSAALVVDGAHLKAALDAFFPNLPPADVRTLAEGLVRTLERTFRVTFARRVIHEATPSGQPSPLAKSLNGAIDARTRPLSPSTGKPVDPNTLEPIDDADDATLLVDTGMEVALSMDLLRHFQKGCEAAVVITARGDVTDALSMASTQGTVWVCGLQRALCPSLNRHSKEGASLDVMLERAAERLWTQWPARRCRPSVSNQRHAHACPDWTGCDYLRRKPNGETRPFTRSKIEHMCQFLHPCAHSHESSSAGSSCHNRAWVHAAWSPGTTPNMSNARWHWDGTTMEEDWLNVVRFALVGGHGMHARLPRQEEDSHTDEEAEDDNPVVTQERDETIFSMSL